MVGRLNIAMTTLIISALFLACAHDDAVRKPLIKEVSFEEIKTRVINQNISIKSMSQEGPFNYKVLEDYRLRVNPHSEIDSDLFVPSHAERAPLVILQHGNLASKATHRKQGEHLASWGFYVLTTSLPNEKKWLQNGKTLGQLITLLNRWPPLVGGKFDERTIILAGHSFGGSASVVAAASGAPLAGMILLDPALFQNSVRRHMHNVQIPVILLGADKHIFYSRRRHAFFAGLNDIAEVSIEGSTHDDATMPSLNETKFFFDPTTDEDKQLLFNAALVISTFSLAITRDNRLAWDQFCKGLGAFIDLRKKPKSGQNCVRSRAP